MTSEQAKYLLSVFDTMFPEIGTDEPLEGSDAVDRLVDLYQQAFEVAG